MNVPISGNNEPERPCPVCGSTDLRPLVALNQIPIHCNVLWPTREGARQAPRGDMRLAFCVSCGHVFNMAFDPALMEYTQAYENSLNFSPKFQSYAESLAQRLIEAYDLRSKDVIELGSGKGEFLTLLADMGGNRCVGFDPSYVPDGNERIAVVQDLYSEKYAHYQADFIACRHVLEHIPSPREFLASVRRSIGDRVGAVVFFEVPNVLYTLRDLGIWDLIYEHCSYFCVRSLARLFTECGFDILEVSEAYGGQFLCIETKPRPGGADPASHSGNDLQVMTTDTTEFAERYHSKVKYWAAELGQIARAGRRAVVWGAGSKGVTFLNTLKVQHEVEYVVDLNPRKQGMHVAGTGQPIVPPEFLKDYRPEVVLIMNPIYQTEIQQLTERLGVALQFVCV